MAQTGYTPISLYYSSTSTNIPSAGNLSPGELALNIADGILYYKNASSAVVPLTSSGVSWQSVQTTSFTATANKAYPINTTGGAVTVTLPASPSLGQQVGVLDYAGTFATNNLTVNPNGGKIEGSTSNQVLNVSRESITYAYIDSTQGWVPFKSFLALPPSYIVSYLIVAGGGGCANSGGGGAGGLLSGSTALNIGAIYTITVGSGGSSSGSPTNGSNSSITGLTAAVGGGAGGAAGGNAGSAGGSGGGGGHANSQTQYAGGAATSGQGNAGGYGYYQGGGGGGGAGAAGSNGSNPAQTAFGGVGGNGGSGLANSITGSSVTYAGGGGATAYNTSAGTGGSGGGGNGALSGSGGNGTSNTGGGGGASLDTAGNGGSGIVILSVPTANYSGVTTGSPTISTSGGNTIISFTASGSYTA